MGSLQIVRDIDYTWFCNNWSVAKRAKKMAGVQKKYRLHLRIKDAICPELSVNEVISLEYLLERIETCPCRRN